MRKIVICLSLVSLLCCMALPCFASSQGGSGSIYTASAPIDYIVYNNGSYRYSVIDWPFNSGRSSSIRLPFEIGDCFVGEGGAYNDKSIRNAAIFGDATSITLHTENLLFTDNYELVLNTEDDVCIFTSIFISARIVVCDIDPVTGTTYVANEIPFAYSTNVGTYSLDIGYHLSRAIKNETNVTTYPALITDLDISIGWYFEPGLDAGYNKFIWFNTTPYNFEYDMGKWLSNQKLDAPVSGQAGGLFDWIIPVISGFMEFEIVPGLSFNSILYFVLIVGIVLWFITLLI